MTKYQVALALGHKIYGREVPVQDVIKEFKMRIENYCLLFTRVLRKHIRCKMLATGDTTGKTRMRLQLP